MNILIIFFLIINILVPSASILFFSKEKKIVEINHIILFSIGFLYYLVLPIIVGINQWFVDKPAMSSWYSIFNSLPEINLITYLVSIFLMYFAFIIGAMRVEIRKKYYIKKNSEIRNFYFSNKVLNLFIFLLTLLTLFFIQKLKNQFFDGYSNEANLVGSEKGSFVAFSLVLFCFVMIYSNKKIELMNSIERKENFHKVIINQFLILYLLVSVLVMSMGGRLYFASGIMSLIVYKSVFFSKIKIKNIFILLLLFIFSMGFLGVYRSASNGFNIESIFFNLFQEPIYTSFSLISFVNDGYFELIKFPTLLLSNFINLVPTFILPNKLEYVKLPVEYGYYIYNPLGAFSLYVSLIINFGLIGSVFFLYFIGNIMSKLKYRTKSILSKTIYVMISGFLTFTFFRDGFETSLIKNILEFSIFVPLIIVLITSFVSEAIDKSK